jgi:hypothetical protein
MHREIRANSRSLSQSFALLALAGAAVACGSSGGGGGRGLAREPVPLKVYGSPPPSSGENQPRPLQSGPQPAPAPTPAATPAPSPTPAPAPTNAPKTAAECKAAALKVLPPAGNQADTQLQMRAFFDTYHEAFRCCFDALWAAQNKGASGTVVLLTSIDASGAFSAAEIEAASTSVQSAEVQTCMIDIAKALTYPKPLSGKDIQYKRVFNFSPRR